MKVSLLASLSLLIPISSFCQIQDADLPFDAPEHQDVNGEFGFMPNKGQLTDQTGAQVPFVLYKGSAPGIDLYITETGATIVLLDDEHSHAQCTQHEQNQVDYARVDMTLEGSVINKELVNESFPSSSVSNYYFPHSPEGILNVRRYGQVVLKDVYPGIDWKWTISPIDGLKHEFIVHPGADLDQIRITYDHADITVMDDGARLQLWTPIGDLVEGAIQTYNGDDQVESAYSYDGYQVTFTVGEYDRDRLLIIDPELAALWGTYIGGGAWEKNTDIKHDIDSKGDVFLTCNTISTNFPTLNPGGGAYFTGTYGGGMAGIQGKGGDMALMKFDNAGFLIWSTYVGGNQDDNGTSIVCDRNDEIWVTGSSMSPNFPTMSWGSAYFQSSNAGGSSPDYEGGDIVMLKLDNDGVLQWSTYYGGTGSERAFDMDNDIFGNIWITGKTDSPDIPLADNGTGYQQAHTGGEDALLAQFNSDGELIHATYYGGSGEEHGEFILTGSNGDIYVTGCTESTNFPVLDMGGGSFFNNTHNGMIGGGFFFYRMDGGDAFVLRFDQDLVQKWGTYLGGSKIDAGRGLTLNSSYDLYLIGDTKSDMDFPLLNGGGYHDPVYDGAGEAFFCKFTDDGVMVTSSYFGGPENPTTFADGNEMAGAILADQYDNVYATGHTWSDAISTVDYGGGAYFIPNRWESDDLFFFQLDPNDNMTWCTYQGSSGFDEKGTCLQVDPCGNLFATGYWCFYSTSNGCVDPGNGEYYAENWMADDFFIMKFEHMLSPGLSANMTPIDASCAGGCDGVLTADAFGSCAVPYSYSWSTGDTTSVITGLCPGVYSVTITDAMGNSVTYTDTIYSGSFSSSISGNLVINYGDTTTLTASGGVTYQWDTGDSTQSITVVPSTTTTYTVIVYDASGCSDTVSVTVTVGDAPAAPIVLEIPNVFSPNNDDHNDIFWIYSEGFVELELWVYNRWGTLVYHGWDIPLGWNGINRNDKEASEGTYYWIVKGFDYTGELHRHAGYLTLLRE